MAAWMRNCKIIEETTSPLDEAANAYKLNPKVCTVSCDYSNTFMCLNITLCIVYFRIFSH